MDLATASEALKQLLVAADVALDEVVDEIEDSSYRMRNPFLSDSDDKSLIVPYRSLFRVLKGRVYAAQAVNSGNPQSSSYRSAYREFELARASVGGANQALLTLCEISSAETAVSHANAFEDYGEVSNIQDDKLKMQTAKLRSAWAYRSTAESRASCRRPSCVIMEEVLALIKARTISLALINEVVSCDREHGK